MDFLPNESTLTVTNTSHQFNANNVFHLYTTGMKYGVAFGRWDEYLRNHIVDNILKEYDSIIIIHCDIIDHVDYMDASDEDKYSLKITLASNNMNTIKNDADHPRVYMSSFTFSELPLTVLDEYHHGINYIVLDFAHLMKYIFINPQYYDNTVSIVDYPHIFRLNCIYMGVIGNDGNTDEIIPSKQQLFNVKDGIVTTFIKIIYENHYDFVKEYQDYSYSPQRIYVNILFKCKRILEVEWKNRYGGLFIKVHHTYGLCDFDDIYKIYTMSDKSPIGSILNMLMNPEKIQIDDIIRIVTDEMMSVFLNL